MNKKLIIALALLAVVAIAQDVAAPTVASCGTGKVWSNDWCAPCAAGCDSCTDPYGCTLCTHSYFRVSTTDETLGCYRPQSTNVVTDPTTSAITTPANGITYTALTACSKDCVDLTGKTAGCVTCNSGFGLQANACAACPANCATCTFAAATGAGVCTKCSGTFYLKGTDCTACPTTLTNCYQCSADATKCDICNTGFYSVSGTCVACASPAATCDSTGKVLTCGTGYFLDISVPATPKCTACAANCYRCTSATVCTTCNWFGFYMASGVCTACPQTDARHCTASTVIQCNDDKTIVGNTCVARIAGCIKHTSATICATCRKGYVFNAGACVMLGDSTIAQVKWCTAATSATDATAAAVCTTCKANPTTGATKAYVIDSTTKACVACPDYATACTVANGTPTVTTCGAGYVKGTTGVTCAACLGIKDAYCVATSASAVKCQTLVSGGADCDGTNVAAPCNEGYVNLAASYTACTACSVNTKTCTAAATSTVCQDGYILASTACAAKCAAAADSNCAGAKCHNSGKRYLTATTTEWVATVSGNCVIISDALTTTNGVQTAATGIVASCSNGYQLLATGNSSAGSCVACSGLVTAATDCTTCSGTPAAAATSYVCTACTTSTNTLQGTSTLTKCDADTNCGAIVASKCLWCKIGYNVNTEGKCTACATGCTFSCPLPSVAAANAAAAAAAKAASSGSFLTFAFSAIVLVLAALF